MKRQRSERILRVASVLTLISLGLMAWAIVDPRPLPVIVAMSVGQGVGTLAVLLFAVVVLRDLRPVMRAPLSMAPPSLRGSGAPPAPEQPSEPPPKSEP